MVRGLPMVMSEEHTATNPRKTTRVSAVYPGRRILLFLLIPPASYGNHYFSRLLRSTILRMRNRSQIKLILIQYSSTILISGGKIIELKIFSSRFQYLL